MAYEGDNGYVALIAEVEVHPESGRIQAKRFVVAPRIAVRFQTRPACAIKSRVAYYKV